jgi:hypothetical protein
VRPEQDENGGANDGKIGESTDQANDGGREAGSKGLDEQVARIERACEDLTAHLYDVRRTFPQ